MIQYLIYFIISSYIIRFLYRKLLIYLITRDNELSNIFTRFISLKNTNIKKLLLNIYKENIKVDNLPNILEELTINSIKNFRYKALDIDNITNLSSITLPKKLKKLVLIGNFYNLQIPDTVFNLSCNIYSLQNNIIPKSFNLLKINVDNDDILDFNKLPNCINKLNINICNYNYNIINIENNLNKFNKLYFSLNQIIYDIEYDINIFVYVKKIYLGWYESKLDKYKNIKKLDIIMNNIDINSKINKLKLRMLINNKLPDTLQFINTYNIDDRGINLSYLPNLIGLRIISYNDRSIIFPDSLQYLCINTWPINCNIPSNLRFLVLINKDINYIDLNIEKIIIDTEFKKEYKYKNLIKYSKYH